MYPNYRVSKGQSHAELPVGLGYVARALELAGIEYNVVDLDIDSSEYLTASMRSFDPEFLGISMLSYRCREVYRLLADVKNTFPRLKIVAGGPHVTANRARVLIECPAIDIGIVGEGEAALVEVVRGNVPALVKGVLYREGEVVQFAGEREFVTDLDRIPFPTYAGFKLERYGKTMVLNSSRGCPYRCVFCGGPRILGRVWRKRSAQGMVHEFEYWYGRGYRHFYINDSNLGVDKGRLREFCDELVKRNIKVGIVADGLRADHFDRLTLEKMRLAGFTSVTFGVESGSDRILRNLRKGETREQIEAAIGTATGLGLEVGLFFLIGSPGEGVEDIEQSFELALKYDVSTVVFFNTTPIPGTEYYEWALSHGYVDELRGSYPEGNFGRSNSALLPTGVLTAAELNPWIQRARRLEHQVEWRQFIRNLISGSVVARFHGNSRLLNSLSWFISHPAVGPVAKSLRKIGRVIARTSARSSQNHFGERVVTHDRGDYLTSF